MAQYVHVGQRSIAVQVERLAAGVYVASAGPESAVGATAQEAVALLGQRLESVVRDALDAELRRRRVTFLPAA